jgi:hypothetical protein
VDYVTYENEGSSHACNCVVRSTAKLSSLAQTQGSVLLRYVAVNRAASLAFANGRVICHGVTSTEEGALYAMANLSSLADTVAIRRCNTQAVADEMLKKDLMYDGPASDSL